MYICPEFKIQLELFMKNKTYLPNIVVTTRCIKNFNNSYLATLSDLFQLEMKPNE